MRLFLYLFIVIHLALISACEKQDNELNSLKLTNTEWIDLSWGIENKNSITYSTEALFGSDILLPDIVDISGKVKFIEGISGNDNLANLGYKINVKVAALDIDKVPQKYKEEKTLKIKDHEVTSLPIEQVVYEILFEFFLKDTDGFVINNIESKKHFIYSGQQNRYQDTVSAAFPINIANRVKSIDFKMGVTKCETCK